MSTASANLTMKGGCHCGHIRYECTVKPDPETNKLKIYRCNCTYCQKLGTTNLHLTGPEDFKLLSPSSKDELSDYQGKIKTIHRYFCATCGVHVWMEGTYVDENHTVSLFVVNLCTADQPQEGLELSEMRFQYWDGLHNNFDAGARDRPWLGGLI